MELRNRLKIFDEGMLRKYLKSINVVVSNNDDVFSKVEETVIDSMFDSLIKKKKQRKRIMKMIKDKKNKK